MNVMCKSIHTKKCDCVWVYAGAYICMCMPLCACYSVCSHVWDAGMLATILQYEY